MGIRIVRHGTYIRTSRPGRRTTNKPKSYIKHRKLKPVHISKVIGSLISAPVGASFVVSGAAQAADSALVTASAEKKWLNGWSASATFEGEFGKGVVRYQW
jgi:hypothetical protein